MYSSLSFLIPIFILSTNNTLTVIIIVGRFIELDELKGFVKQIEYTFRCRTNWNRRKDFILVLYYSKILGLFSGKISSSVNGNVVDDDSLSQRDRDGLDNATGSNSSSRNGICIGTNSSSSSDTGLKGVDNTNITTDNSRILSINISQPTPKTAKMKVFESKDMITSILKFL